MNGPLGGSSNNARWSVSVHIWWHGRKPWLSIANNCTAPFHKVQPSLPCATKNTPIPECGGWGKSSLYNISPCRLTTAFPFCLFAKAKYCFSAAISAMLSLSLFLSHRLKRLQILCLYHSVQLTSKALDIKRSCHFLYVVCISSPTLGARSIRILSC